MSSRFISNGVVVNGTYKHFKGNIYTVYCIATDTEDDSLKVVYGADNKMPWVRPLDMFLSEVDHEKYPNTDQKYRFEYVPALSDETKARVYNEYLEMDGPAHGMDNYLVVDIAECPHIISKDEITNESIIDSVPLMKYLV